MIELLVVIAIISLLVSILLPSLSKAKDVARRAVCATNQRGIGQALMVYATEHEGRFPPHVGIYPYHLMILDGTDYATAHIYGETSSGMHIRLNYKLDVVDPFFNGGQLLICPSNQWVSYEQGVQTPLGPSSSGCYFLASSYAILPAYITWGQDNVWLSPDGMTDYDTPEGVEGLSAAQTPMTADRTWSGSVSGTSHTPGQGNHDPSGGTQYNQPVPGENVGYLDGSVEWKDVEYLELGWWLNGFRLFW